MNLHAVGSPMAGPTSAAKSETRLIRAAHEFEGQMLKELLKPLTSMDLSGTETDGDSEDGSAGILGEFASEALGQALSEHGGFGIAERILGQLAGRHSGAAGVTGGKAL